MCVASITPGKLLNHHIFGTLQLSEANTLHEVRGSLIASCSSVSYHRAMRVVVVGGAGEVGSVVSEDLASCAEIDELLIADRDRGLAEALATRIDATHVTARELDVDDPGSAREVLADADVLMNCTPFAHFDRVIELACEYGLQYADLISEPTDQQRQSVEAAGITAVSGLGATPGLSNVLARHAAEEFERLEEVHVSWVSLRTVAPTRGGLGTILWELGEDCPTRQYYDSGRFESAAAFDGARTVEFAPPVSTQRVYHVPHTEVQTLPKNLPDLRACSVRGTWRPQIMAEIEVLNKYGLLSNRFKEMTSEAIWERFGGQRDDASWPLFVNVEVVGTQGGEMAGRVYEVSHPIEWGQEGMARMTGTCAGVGAQLLARQGRTEAGFVDPEVYFDPFEFLAELERRGTVVVATRERELSEKPALRG